MSSSDDEYTSFRVLTWNVWSIDALVAQRAQAIGAIVSRARPDFVVLQEVGPAMLGELSTQWWWKKYAVGPHPPGQPVFTAVLALKATVKRPVFCGRVFCTNDVRDAGVGFQRDIRGVVGTVHGLSVTVLTTHLIRGYRGHQQWREAQAWLQSTGDDDVIVAGDFNWYDTGAPPEAGTDFKDSWLEANAAWPVVGHTHGTHGTTRAKPSRPDRVLARLRRWRPTCGDLVGTRPLDDVKTHGPDAEKLMAQTWWPSDHLGVLIRYVPL